MGQASSAVVISPGRDPEKVHDELRDRALIVLMTHSSACVSAVVQMRNGGIIKHAQALAADESPHTTKLCDCASDTITLDEIERIVI